MARGDLAAFVLSTEVFYGDGTSIEDWKPATPGATAGAPAGTDVAGKPATDLVTEAEETALAHIRGLADAELARIRTRKLLFPAPDGASVFTLIRREETERVDGEDATAAIFELIGTVNATGSAFILGERAVFARKDATGATQYVGLTAQMGAQSASIERIDQVLIGPSGGLARAMLRLDVNGRIVGYDATATGTRGALRFSFDQVSFEDPDTGKRYFYLDDTGKAVLGDIEARSLAVDTVTVREMAQGSAQKVAFYALPSTIAVPRSSTVQIAALTFFKEDKDSVLEIQMLMKCASDDDFQFDATIQVNGMVMDTTPVNVVLVKNDARLPITPFTYASGIAAGSHTIAVKIYNRESDVDDLSVLAGSTLKVTELRKASIGSVTGTSGGALPAPGTGGQGSGAGGGYDGKYERLQQQ